MYALNYLYYFFVEETRLDPNDPRNTKLLSLVDSIRHSQPSIYFNLVDVDVEQMFISDKDFSSDRRCMMLHFRDQGVSFMFLECTLF